MTIRRYIVKEILLAFFISFLFFFFLFFLNQILLMAEEILKKKAPLDEVLLLMVYSLPAILALTAPFATLLGILLAVGRLSSDREILAAQACGIAHQRLFIPALVLGLCFTAGSFFANDVLLPAGTVNFSKVYRQLVLSTPALELQSYSVHFYKTMTIATGAVKDTTVQGVTILDRTNQEDQRLITAKTARLIQDPQRPGVITLHLVDIVGVVPDARRPGAYDSFTAKTVDYNLVLRDMIPGFQSIGPREMRSFDLARQITEKAAQNALEQQSWREALQNTEWRLRGLFWSGQSRGRDSERLEQELASRLTELRNRDLTDRVLQNWKTELYQKFSIPLACLCFVILAYPMAVIQTRRGLAAIIGVGFLTSLLYWACLLLARTLSLEWSWTPEFVMFLPNVLIMMAGGFLFWRLRR